VLLRRADRLVRELLTSATPRLGQGAADDFREGLLLVSQTADLIDRIRI